MRRVPATQRNKQIRRERDVRALSRLALLLFCGAVLAAGFVFAAKQHFAAVTYGYHSETLRQDRQQLLREQQQLLLKKEQASAPARLESAARALGLKPILPGQVGTGRVPSLAGSAAVISRANSAPVKSKTAALPRR
jgi:cell division protein FtsL